MAITRTFFLTLLCFWPVLAWSHDKIELRPLMKDYALSKVTERVYVVHGPQEMPNKHTEGFMNNPAFVLSGKGVVVIDPGSSVQIGLMLLEKIRSVTKAAVIAVFNTHVHGDHWLGNHAIQRAYPQAVIYAHPGMIKRLKAGEGQEWLNIMDQLTEGAVRGTEVVAPGKSVNHGDRVKLGDRTFRIHHTGKAHTDSDIMIEVMEERVIFLGDIVTNRRIQSARPQDMDIKGQIAAIDHALGTSAKYFIPGHGLSNGRDMVESTRGFMQALLTSVRKHFQAGLSDFEMNDKVKQDLSAYKDWRNFDRLGRVISFVYLQVEAEAF